jgi:hypothetical protein
MPKKTPSTKSKIIIKRTPKPRKSSKTRKQSTLNKEVEEIEKWIHERRKFFKKLIYIIIAISILLLLARFI